MKKLVFGSKFVKVNRAICDYCGEEKELCFEITTKENCLRRNIELEYEYVFILNIEKHFKVPFFGRPYYKMRENEGEGKWLVKKDKWEHKTIKTHICRDCAKQIAKFKEE